MRLFLESDHSLTAHSKRIVPATSKSISILQDTGCRSPHIHPCYMSQRTLHRLARNGVVDALGSKAAFRWPKRENGRFASVLDYFTCRPSRHSDQQLMFHASFACSKSRARVASSCHPRHSMARLLGLYMHISLTVAGTW